MSRRHISSKPDHWTNPRPYTDASLRYRAYGPIEPMDCSGTRAPLWKYAVAVALVAVVLWGAVV